MIRFLSMLPQIEDLLIFGLFAALILDYFSMLNAISKTESADNHASKRRIIPTLVGMAFLATVLVIAISMINT